MSSGRFRLVPAQAYCSRCKELFVYFRSNRAQEVCRPCVPLEAQDANRFYSRFRSSQRTPEAASAHPD